MESYPLVSIYMTTYYHEKYISQAIDSVIAQKVSFPIEIVISDDASKDETPNILKSYEKKYSFIKVNVNESNIGLTANMYLAKSLCCGKYICDLSGDDYWIDDRKLQKQVDFLENNPEYYSVCTRIEIRPDFETKAIECVPPMRCANRDFTLEMFLNGDDLPMNGMMMKNPFLNKDDKELFSIMPKISPYIDDVTDSMLILKKGKSYILPDVTTVYRVRKLIKNDHNYNTISKGMDTYKKHIELLNNLYIRFGSEINLYKRYRLVNVTGIKEALRRGSIQEFISIYKTSPKEYRKDALLLDSAMHLPSEILKCLKRRINDASN